MTIRSLIFTWVLFVGVGACGTHGEEPSQALNTPAQEIKILTIGNSFTGNATSFLQKLAQGGGKKMTLFVAAIGGYTLEEHVRCLQAYDANPQNPKGQPYRKNSSSLREALQKEDWDVVTIQQSSVRSMKPETFQPSTDILIAYIRKYAPHARILLFETWAYPDDYYDQVPKAKLDRTSMRRKVKSTYQEISNQTGLAVIPVGEAFERVTCLEKPITLTNPNDKHCNSQGQYLSGAVLYEVIYRDNVESNSFIPREITPEEAKTLLRVAHETIAASPLNRTLAAKKEK